MKNSFLGAKRPKVTVMIDGESAEESIAQTKNSVYDGADGFGFEMEKLNLQEHTLETYRNIFSYTEDFPVYVTNYRGMANGDKSDEALAEDLLLMQRAGAGLIDIMGDLYDQQDLGITDSPAAVEKQIELVRKIHKGGGSVLISTHTFKFMEPSDVLDIALKQQKRGADIAKIVTAANNEEEFLSNEEALLLLKRKLDIPFIFLAVGNYCKLQRSLCALLFSPMILCKERYQAGKLMLQPLAGPMRKVIDNIDWTA